MKYLLIVNSKLRKKTAWFWAKNRKKIIECFPQHDLWFPTTLFFKVPLDINEYDVIVLIGDDTFYSCFINSIFYELTSDKKQTSIAFIPDNKKSAVTKDLGIDPNLSVQCELITKKHTILLDLVRCHYLDKKGIPRSHFVLNDSMVGMSPARLPFLVKSLAEIAKNTSILPNRKKGKQIKVYSDGSVIFDGKYTFSAIMLGRKPINGPTLLSRKKNRCNLSGFDYLQLNSNSNQQFKNQPSESNRFNHKNRNRYLISGVFNELTIKGEGTENTVIVDGIHLGKLPATFSFLPKSIRVIAPLLTMRVSQPWQKKVSTAGIPKPIGSRNSLRTKAKK